MSTVESRRWETTMSNNGDSLALHSRMLLDSLEDNTVVLVRILCKNHKR